MAEYIERKILKSEMTEAMCGTGYQQWAIDVIDRLPTADVVEVVRCKDCEHLTEKGICEKFRQRYPFYPEDDFHCGFGKRKEGAEK